MLFTLAALVTPDLAGEEQQDETPQVLSPNHRQENRMFYKDQRRGEKMNRVRVILLEDCSGDRTRMLSHLYQLEDELAQLSARALALPIFQEGLMAAWEEKAGFTRCLRESRGSFTRTTKRSAVLFFTIVSAISWCAAAQAKLF